MSCSCANIWGNFFVFITIRCIWLINHAFIRWYKVTYTGGQASKFSFRRINAAPQRIKLRRVQRCRSGTDIQYLANVTFSLNCLYWSCSWNVWSDSFSVVTAYILKKKKKLVSDLLTNLISQTATRILKCIKKPLST